MNISQRYITEYYKAHIADLRAYIARCTGDADLAADLAHDVFVRMLGIDGVITPATLHALAIRIARNLVTDHLRRRRNAGIYERHVKAATILLGGSPVAASADDPFTVYSAVEVNELLERGMARLTDDCRRIYRMNIIDGKKVSEISDELHINYKLVERRLGMARKVVRRYMALVAG